MGQLDAARNRVNVVILDACRNNPFGRRFRSPQRGLAFMQAPLGTFIAYATSPGDVADDGSAGGYGVFTGELLKAMREPLRIEDVFKRVALAVQQRTQRRQTPWIASNLTGEFSFAASAPFVVERAPSITTEIVRDYGSLAIRSGLSGVEIWLGEERIGETQAGATLIVNNVGAGRHTLRGRKVGQQDWVREVEVAANQRTQVVIDELMAPAPRPRPEGLMSAVPPHGTPQKPQIVSVSGCWSGPLTGRQGSPTTVFGTIRLCLSQTGELVTGTYELKTRASWKADVRVQGKLEGPSLSLTIPTAAFSKINATISGTKMVNGLLVEGLTNGVFEVTKDP